MIMADTSSRGSGARTQTSIAIDKLRTAIVTGKLRPNE